MIKKSKSAVTFAIIFITWGIITFIKSLSGLLYHIFQTFVVPADSGLIGYGELSGVTWAVNSVGILGICYLVF